MDRAKLEESIRSTAQLQSYRPLDATFIIGGGALEVLRAAASAHLATLPKTKMVEIALIARMSADGSTPYCCLNDTPANRHEVGRLVLQHGGQMVTLKGVAEVPA